MIYDISPEDIKIIFTGCLLSYKGELVYSHRLSGNKLIVEFLKDNSIKSVPFVFEHFTGVQQRLGFVNFNIGCVYISRRPVRRYSIGLNRDNVRPYYLTDQRTNEYLMQTLNQFRDSGFLHMYEGNYPSLLEAFQTAQDLNTVFAFDRQFAVDSEGKVYYRNAKLVGFYNPSTNKIEFVEEFKYLSSLLDGSYGKSA